MIKLYHRYIFKSVLFAGLSGIVLFVFVLITGNAIRDIFGAFADGRITLSMLLELLGLLVPYSASFALPIGLLMGVLVILGRMSAQQEITALKASGISIWHISAPIILIAFGGILFSLLINNFYAPVAKTRYRNILRDLVRQNPLQFIVPKTFIEDFPGYVLYVGNKRGNTLEDFWIWELGPHKQALRLLRAKEGLFEYRENEDALILTLRDGFSELRSERNPDDLQSIRPVVSFKNVRLRLPLGRILGHKKKVPNKGIQHVNLAGIDLFSLFHYQKLLKEEFKEAKLNLESGLVPKGQRDLLVIQEDLVQVSYRIQKNFALGFSVLGLTLLGIPLGIKASRSETYANVGIAIALAMVYYVALVIVDWNERNPSLRPDLLVWIPNITFQGIGLSLLNKASKN